MILIGRGLDLKDCEEKEKEESRKREVETEWSRLSCAVLKVCAKPERRNGDGASEADARQMQGERKLKGETQRRSENTRFPVTIA